MSEIMLSTPENLQPILVSNTPISGGAMLRNAREAEGLHIAALAVLLKVPVKKLEALETDQFDLLPDTVFVRALAASVCRALKIDSTQILERLPHTAVPHLKTDESGINKSFRAHGHGSGMSFRNQLSKPLVLAVLALLTGVVVMISLPLTQRRIENVLPPQINAASVISHRASSETVVMSTENSTSSVAVALTPVPSLTASSSDAQVAIKTLTATSSASVPDAALNASLTNVSGSGITTGIIVFTARGTSWVEVVDANGVIQLRKTMINGEVVGATGAIPLAVVVGRANTIEVQVHGKTLDIASLAKDNVARFEVR